MYLHLCPSCSNEFQNEKQSVACTRCGGLTESKPTEAEKERLKKLYLEQQKRLSCPGCGESPFLG